VKSLKDNPCAKQQFCFPEKGVIVFNYPPIDKPAPNKVDVEGTSSLIPSGNNQETHDLTERAFGLRFYKAGGFIPNQKSDDLNWLTSGKVKPDLQLEVYAKIREEDGFSLAVTLQNNEIQQGARFVKGIIWSQTGDIASILDLANSNLVVDGANVMNAEFDLKCIELEIQPGRSIWIPRDEMQVLLPHTWGSPIYFFRMPDNLARLDQTCI
jgi:hypothetical protein